MHLNGINRVKQTHEMYRSRKGFKGQISIKPKIELRSDLKLTKKDLLKFLPLDQKELASYDNSNIESFHKKVDNGLTLMVCHNRPDLLKYLLNREVSILASNVDGLNCLHVIVMYDSMEAFEMIMQGSIISLDGK